MERRAEEEAYARGMQQMLYQQEAQTAQQALYQATVGPISLPTPGGVAQIPTGLAQAGYEPGKYVSTAEDPYRGVRERWFGGRRGAAQELVAAWAGGGQPLRVPRQIQQMLGMSDAEMSLMGYGREPLGSWRAKPYQAPGDVGDGGAGGAGGYYQVPRVRYGGGTSRAAGYGAGLINWRIGL